MDGRSGQDDLRIVIIDIDNATLTNCRTSSAAGRGRAGVTENCALREQGRRVAIVFDAARLQENRKTHPAMDDDFARVMRNSGKTVLGFSFLSAELKGEEQTARPDASAFATQGKRLGSELESGNGRQICPLDRLRVLRRGWD